MSFRRSSHARRRSNRTPTGRRHTVVSVKFIGRFLFRPSGKPRSVLVVLPERAKVLIPNASSSSEIIDIALLLLVPPREVSLGIPQSPRLGERLGPGARHRARLFVPNGLDGASLPGLAVLLKSLAFLQNPGREQSARRRKPVGEQTHLSRLRNDMLSRAEFLPSPCCGLTPISDGPPPPALGAFSTKFSNVREGDMPRNPCLPPFASWLPCHGPDPPTSVGVSPLSKVSTLNLGLGNKKTCGVCALNNFLSFSISFSFSILSRSLNAAAAPNRDQSLTLVLALARPLPPSSSTCCFCS